LRSLPFVMSTPPSEPTTFYDAVKRLVDVGVSAAVLLALGPTMLGLAALIRLDSKGPALYLGRRIGRGGTPFHIYKFRTMRVDAERLGTTTHVEDPRITRVGWLLRKYKLDEFPQFLNVLKGEMSVVGPRPEVEEHTSEYTEEEKAILTVKPGITDFASIRFVDLAKELGTEDPHKVYLTRVRSQKNQLRLRYVRERSLSTDFKIVGLTALAILNKARRSK
jgi:lipopolysaccharide/colanic/teichoic acid biosynthesis glycosyltransferase